MSVKDNSQYRFNHKDTEYLFCSEHCLTKFKNSPDGFLVNTKDDSKATSRRNHDKHNPAAAPVQRLQNIEHICPMCPEVSKIGPGACPSCGMALEPAALPIEQTKTQYTCPMHPEVIQDEPGSCPKCGMALEPAMIKKTETTQLVNDVFSYS